ncbi:hypothetical protein HPB51_017504 [Rhipicephalus microplus]|uniref:Uncharacterized protein n=1 Tax=Rhipicephalus microplus TaxID=6941 RepID=A0A9J6F4F6_RHIMP|nr:hypothetical protein HPB51_017504 [Rhipicephalus microplus]
MANVTGRDAGKRKGRSLAPVSWRAAFSCPPKLSDAVMASDRRERWKFVCYLAVVLPVLVRCEGNQACSSSEPLSALVAAAAAASSCVPRCTCCCEAGRSRRCQGSVHLVALAAAGPSCGQSWPVQVTPSLFPLSSVDPHARLLHSDLASAFPCARQKKEQSSRIVPVLCAVVLFALTAARPVRAGRLFHGLSAALPAAHARKSPLRKLFSPQRTFGDEVRRTAFSC